MSVIGIRGATTAASNDREPILDATAELLRRLVESNQIEPSEIACVFFSATPDLDAEYPALAARERLKWSNVPLFGQREMAPPGALKRCIRILILWNSPKSQADAKFIYLRGAARLRDEK